MPDPIQAKILEHLKSAAYRPQRARGLARDLNLHQEGEYHAFRQALKDLMHEGRVMLGAGGHLLLPTSKGGLSQDEFTGTYRHNPRGFGFVIPTDPTTREDLYIPEGENGGALTGDIVRAKITNCEQREGKMMCRGRIVEIITRTQKRFAGSLVKQQGKWMVLPDGNTLTSAIFTPDAAARHIRPGTKVVVELTSYPEGREAAQGVITQVLGAPGEKDVDLRAIMVQFNLPEEFEDKVLAEARMAMDRFGSPQTAGRLDLSNEIICTIDPDDAKDYDDAISLTRLKNGQWELGVHIADVSHFVPRGSALDEEALSRGNSCYFPGFVIPMLPEVLSNGVCSLQEGVPRFCKSAFITFGDDAQPVASRFANTVIRSANRLRYREAQAILDGSAEVPHPDGTRTIDSYKPAVVELLHQMHALAKRIQKRRLAAGQIVLDLPEVELVLNEDGKVVGTASEDDSFTHTLIEMFMVEANEAVARLLDSMNVPFLRRVHPPPKTDQDQKLRQFVEAGGYKLPKVLDRKAIQTLLAAVKGKPEAFAINLSILRSLSRAEYSPQVVGHYALASEHYCHFTSPIRRYADLMIHRLLEEYFRAGGGKQKKVRLEHYPSEGELVETGKHLSFTERRADDAERELRQVKVLELLMGHVGEDFAGVVTGITNFGIFIQLSKYLIDGLIRYEELMDDWWDVDVMGGVVRGQRTGRKIGIGDMVTARIARVDPARRQLDLAIIQLHGRAGQLAVPQGRQKSTRASQTKRGGQNRRQRKRRR